MKWPTLDEASHFSIEVNKDYLPLQAPQVFMQKVFRAVKGLSRLHDRDKVVLVVLFGNYRID